MFSRAATTRNDWSAADWYKFLMDFCQLVKFWYEWLVKADC